MAEVKLKSKIDESKNNFEFYKIRNKDSKLGNALWRKLFTFSSVGFENDCKCNIYMEPTFYVSHNVICYMCKKLTFALFPMESIWADALNFVFSRIRTILESMFNITISSILTLT